MWCPRYQALILDFGGVISRTLFETHAQTEKALGLPAGSLTWRGPFDPDSDPLWCAMQADALSERDYWRQRTREVAKLVGQQWTEMHEFLRAARAGAADDIIRPEALDAIERLRSAGKRLAILSNELDLFYGADFRAALPWLRDFDVIHDATYTHTMKPDLRAYTACVAALHLTPSECVFVDDQQRNVDGAQRAGLRAVRFDVRYPHESYAEALDLFGLDL